jgi:cell division protein FtsA
MVKEKLDKLTLSRPLGGGVVLSGGGAQLLGAAELASHVFKLPVRVGNPLPLGGLVEEYRSPVYAAAVGLVLEGNDREVKSGLERGGEIRLRDKGQANIIEKLSDWLQKEFF